MWTVRASSIFLAVLALALPAAGQSVISTHSGVIYYFDGSVYLGDQPLQPHLGKFASVPQGAELRTAKGHAEVLLTPGVFLRMGDAASIRMLANDLADTRVELESGSVIVDSGESNSGTAVTLVFKDWQVRSPQAGSYRIDSDPPRLWVLQGQAEVLAGAGDRRVTVTEGEDLPLAAALTPELSPEQSGAEPADGLSEWSKGRGDSVVADDSITQQIDADPASQTSDLGGFVSFPYVGLPPMGLTLSPYGSPLGGQPGFYSPYLPGYTYAPMMLTIMGRGRGAVPRLPLRLGMPPVRTGIGSPPVRTGINPGLPGIGMPVPIVPQPRPAPIHPIVPRPPLPAHPIGHPIAHPIPHPAVHR